MLGGSRLHTFLNVVIIDILLVCFSGGTYGINSFERDYFCMVSVVSAANFIAASCSA